MGSTAQMGKAFSGHAMDLFPFDPGSSSPTIAPRSWVSMGGFSGFACLVGNDILNGRGLVMIEIVGGSDERGANAVQIVSTGIIPSKAPRPGDFVPLEIGVAQLQEMAQRKNLLRFVGVRVTVDNPMDRVIIWLCRKSSHFDDAALTQAVIH